MKAHVYLNFDGTCAEAFDFYKSVFGGDFAMKQTFGDAPMANEMPAEMRDRVMHVSLPLGDNLELMGSDTMPGMGKPFVAGTNTHVSLMPDSREQADQLFVRLSENGSQDMPMENQFWGAYFGMCTDRFGVQWMINLPTATS